MCCTGKDAGESSRHGLHKMWAYGIGAQNFFTVQLQDHTQHTMRSGMLRTMHSSDSVFQLQHANSYPKLTIEMAQMSTSVWTGEQVCTHQ